MENDLRREVEQLLQEKLQEIQNELVEQYETMAKSVIQTHLDQANLGAIVSKVQVTPPQKIIDPGSEGPYCFRVYIPGVGFVTICLPVLP